MKILATASPGEVRVAAVDGVELVDFAIWRPGDPDGVGDVHRGRVIYVAPAMAGTFVAIAGAEGFLPYSDAGTAPLSVGTLLGVRIVRAAQGGKGPRLTARLSMADAKEAAKPGRVALIRSGLDPVRRLANLHPGAQVAVDDRLVFASLKDGLRDRVVFVTSAFNDDLEAAVQELGQVQIELLGGARMSVYPTPALTAIDVDLASASAERTAKTRAQMAANQALLPRIAAQIRLRNLSGAILLDLAGIPARKRAALGPELARLLASDPLGPKLLGFTALGLAEIVRSRVHPPLHELLAGAHAAGLSALRHLAREIAATPVRPPFLRAAPAVANALERDAIARADLARRAGRPLILKIDRGLAPLGWSIEP